MGYGLWAMGAGRRRSRRRGRIWTCRAERGPSSGETTVTRGGEKPSSLTAGGRGQEHDSAGRGQKRRRRPTLLSAKGPAAKHETAYRSLGCHPTTTGSRPCWRRARGVRVAGSQFGHHRSTGEHRSCQRATCLQPGLVGPCGTDSGATPGTPREVVCPGLMRMDPAQHCYFCPREQSAHDAPIERSSAFEVLAFYLRNGSA